MKKRNFAIALTGLSLALGSLSFISSCTTQEPIKEVISVTSVEITTLDATLNINETLTLSYSVLPENASNKKVSFSSSNNTVAKVDSNGKISALAVGEALITIKTEDGGKTDSIKITVIDNPIQTTTTIEDVTKELDSSVYTSNIESNNEFGLIDASNVGVKKDDIKEKYQIPNVEEMENGNVITFEELTLQDIQSVIPSANESNDYYRFQASLLLAKEASKEGKVSKIVLPSRTLDVDASLSTSGYAFVLDDAKNVYVEGNGASFSISINQLNWKGFINVTNTEDFILKDVTVDFKLHSALTGKIVETNLDERTITVDVLPEFNNLVSLLEDNKIALRSYLEFDLITNAPRQDGNFVVDNFNGYDILKDGENYKIKVHFTSEITMPGNGDLANLAFTQYDAPGMTFNNDKDVKIENVTLHHASGMAFTASETENLLVNRFNLKLKEGSSSIMTSTADGMHLDKCSGEVTIENSLIENSHDDALNIKQGYWYRVKSVDSRNREITLAKITGEMPLPQVGDTFAIYNEETYVGHNPSDGSYEITKVETNNSGDYVLTVSERMSNASEWGNCRATFLSNTPNFTFRNNIVRNKRNRGVLVQIPNSLIENNTFQNVGHGSIQCANAMDQYNECTIPNGVTIRNNKFINNTYILPEPLLGDVSVFAISNNASVAPAGTVSNVTIENNYFTKNGNAAISLRGVSDTAVNGNLFNNCSRTQPSGDEYNCLLNLYNCESISVSNNYNNYTLDEGLSGIKLQGMTTEDGVSLSNNHEVGFEVNAEQGANVDVKKATSSFTIDGELSDWTEGNYQNVDLLGYSEATGVQVSPTDLEDHFKINKLMLSYDDLGIYVGFDVFDDEQNITTINDFWLGDCVEIFISNVINMPSADMMVYKDQGGVIQAAFAPTFPNSFTYGQSRTNSAYYDKVIETSFKVNETGYSGEILFSFENFPELKTSIDNKERICMAIVIADAERSSGIKRVQAGNVPHFVESNKTKTQLMPRYLFE